MLKYRYRTIFVPYFILLCSGLGPKLVGTKNVTTFKSRLLNMELGKIDNLRLLVFVCILDLEYFVRECEEQEVVVCVSFGIR